MNQGERLKFIVWISSYRFFIIFFDENARKFVFIDNLLTTSNNNSMAPLAQLTLLFSLI